MSKVDSITKDALTGAVFNLYKQNTYNSNLWELYKANISMTSGSMLVDSLTFGSYRFEEVKAPDGYLLPENAFGVFTIDSLTPTTSLEVTLENTKAVEYGDLQFEKTDSEDSNVKLIATFEVHKKIDDSLVTTVTTDSSGVGSVSHLEVGDYYLVEITPPEGYVLDSTHHDFTITKDTINNVYTGQSSLKNIRMIEYGSLQFEKEDSVDSNTKLVATFEIHKKTDDSLVTTVTTDSSGNCSVNNLEVGDYYLLETMAPSGYELDSTPHDFSIVKDSNNRIYLGSNAIKNTKAARIIDYGNLQFEKVDGADSNIKLEATFEIRKKETDELVRTVTTDQNGQCLVNKLEAGNYYLVETVAPKGYVLDKTNHAFVITKDETNRVYTGLQSIKNSQEKKPSDKLSGENLPKTGGHTLLFIGLVFLVMGIFIRFKAKKLFK